MKKPTVRLCVEEMESRLVPSGAPLHHPAPGLVAHAATQTTPALSGTVSGTYTIPSETPPDSADEGKEYSLQHGSGTLTGVGAVTATGTLQSLGNIVSGHAGGTVTLTGAKGTITLKLTGPVQKGFDPLPTHFTYTVTRTTGGYGQLKGQHGTADLTLGAASGTTPGSFTLVLHPKAR